MLTKTNIECIKRDGAVLEIKKAIVNYISMTISALSNLTTDDFEGYDAVIKNLQILLNDLKKLNAALFDIDPPIEY